MGEKGKRKLAATCWVIDEKLLSTWHYNLDSNLWLLSIAAKIEHQMRRAERWDRELVELEDGGATAAEVEARLADFVRQEQFARSERARS